ncbi:MAG TPA: YqgE/AlgH family protein [Candidatus Binatia bacterium]|jgi:putative transcriptional regulator
MSAVVGARAARFWLATLILYVVSFSPHLPLGAAENDQLEAGKLLVATDELLDPRFFESVIYLVKHDAEGTVGLIINRPVAKGSIDDLLKGFGAEPSGSQLEVIIHYGGPVSSGHGFLLHSDDKTLDKSIKAPHGLAMTSDIRMIQAIATGTGPRHFLFALGYAGWAPGQLEDEVKANSWLVVPSDNTLVFGTDPGEKRRRAMDKRQIRL